MTTMETLILVLYGAFMVVTILLLFFIWYHLKRYTINHQIRIFLLFVFVAVSLVLVAANILLFLTLPLQELFPERILY